jgi:hypothetical protein
MSAAAAVWARSADTGSAACATAKSRTHPRSAAIATLMAAPSRLLVGVKGLRNGWACAVAWTNPPRPPFYHSRAAAASMKALDRDAARRYADVVL